VTVSDNKELSGCRFDTGNSAARKVDYQKRGHDICNSEVLSCVEKHGDDRIMGRRIKNLVQWSNGVNAMHISRSPGKKMLPYQVMRARNPRTTLTEYATSRVNGIE
jgi:hypothetical protein